MPTPLCIFLDRDGTLMADKHYLSDPAGVELLPQAAAGLRLLQQAGCPLVVLTNQSGLRRGYFDAQALQAVNQRLETLLRAEGVRLAGIWHCPHSPEDRCDCRKPAPGLALAAVEALGLGDSLRLGRVVSVGDKCSDVRLGQKLGGRGVLVLTGQGRELWEQWEAFRETGQELGQELGREPEQEPEQKAEPYTEPSAEPDHVAAHMLDAARWIVDTLLP